jgi:hypothetical protein
VAAPTVAKSPNPHQFPAEILRPFALPICPKPQPEFLVFPTGTTEYLWRVAALATTQTVSRHKSLTFALRKCTRLNAQRREGVRNETN